MEAFRAGCDGRREGRVRGQGARAGCAGRREGRVRGQGARAGATARCEGRRDGRVRAGRRPGPPQPSRSVPELVVTAE